MQFCGTSACRRMQIEENVNNDWLNDWLKRVDLFEMANDSNRCMSELQVQRNDAELVKYVKRTL